MILNPSHIVGRYDTEGWSKSIRLVAVGEGLVIPPGRLVLRRGRRGARTCMAVDRGRTGENYIFGGADATYLELVTTIGELLGKKVGKSAAPLWVIRMLSGLTRFGSIFTGSQPAVTREMVEGLTHHEIVSCEKAVRELGFEKVPLRSMLETALAWQVEEGIVKRGVGA